MISKAVCKMLAVSIALAIVVSGIEVNVCSAGDISISDAVALTNAQDSTSYTFKDLGYKSSTYTEQDESVTIEFNSPYKEASGDLILHLNVLDDGYVEAKINGATIFSAKWFREGEQYWEKIEIPTGMINKGTNTLTISFPDNRYEITLLADSKINISGTYLTFSCSPENPIIDEIITFNASSSYENIIKYDWDFGDGTTAGGKTAMHSYHLAGGYSVTLTVTHDGGKTDTTIMTVHVGMSRWEYNVTIEEHGEETKTGLLTLTFMGWEHVGGYNASVFYVANTVPEEPSNYEIILANTGDFMEKYVTENQKYAKLLPINPIEDEAWPDGISLLTNMTLGQATAYYSTEVEDIEVPAGNFSCFLITAKYDLSMGEMKWWSSVDEWWDEEGRGLIQAKYNKGGLWVGGYNTIWEYKLANSTDPLFPINYMGI
jgi:hypothetical protein